MHKRKLQGFPPWKMANDINFWTFLFRSHRSVQKIAIFSIGSQQRVRVKGGKLWANKKRLQWKQKWVLNFLLKLLKKKKQCSVFSHSILLQLRFHLAWEFGIVCFSFQFSCGPCLFLKGFCVCQIVRIELGPIFLVGVELTAHTSWNIYIYICVCAVWCPLWPRPFLLHLGVACSLFISQFLCCIIFISGQGNRKSAVHGLMKKANNFLNSREEKEMEVSGFGSYSSSQRTPQNILFLCPTCVWQLH